MNRRRPHSPSSESSDGSIPGREGRLLAAIENYRNLLDTGQAVDRQQFLQGYADIGEELDRCLAGIDVMQRVVKQVTAKPPDSPTLNASPGLANHTLGDFRIAREIGRGGMGIVYEAEQLSLGRTVALKVLPFATMLDDRHLQRFKNEARAAATLNHPNIVPVHFVGAHRGVHFYAMQMIDGQSLSELIERLRDAESHEPTAATVAAAPQADTKVLAALSTQRSRTPKRYYESVAKFGVQIAKALDHAHEHGIVHRDIKPGNVLIDRRGMAWITDFGLARIEADHSMTVSGDLLGTLRYMSPEQATGERAMVDHRTDIFSLGATLYELATLRPAFDASHRETLLRQVCDEPPPAPRTINPAIPADLETILLKALEKDPLDRFASAKEMAEDLRRFLSDEPIRARRPTLLARAAKWSRRHTTLFVSATLILATALIGTLAAFALTRVEQARTISALEDRDAALLRADQNLDIALDAVDDMYLEFGMRWIASETAPTMLQRGFLSRARDVYLSVAQQDAESAKKRERAATAFERIAQIDLYLERFESVGEAIDRAIELGETLAAEQPSNEELRAAMLRRYRIRASSRLLLGDVSGAETDYEQGAAHLRAMLQPDPDSRDYLLDKVQFQQDRAIIELQRNRSPEAITLLRESEARLNSWDPTEDVPTGYRMTKIRNGLLMARALMAQEDDAAADQVLNGMLETCRYVRTSKLSDERQMWKLEADLLQLLGEVAEARGDFAEAATHYGLALTTREQSLKGGMEPSQRMMPSAQGYDGEWEPSGFCDYLELQVRLARVLRHVGRLYEAEYLLSRGMLSIYVIAADRPNVLRYHVAEANLWTEVWQLLRSERPSDWRAKFEPARRCPIMTWTRPPS